MGREPEAGAQAGKGARVWGGGTWKTLQPDSSPHWGQGLSSPASLPISQVQQVYPTELPKLCSPNPVLLPPLGVPRVLKNPTFSLGTKSHPNLPLPAQDVSPAFTGPCMSPPPLSPGTSTSFQPCTWTAAPHFPNPRRAIGVIGFFLSISTHTHRCPLHPLCGHCSGVYRYLPCASLRRHWDPAQAGPCHPVARLLVEKTDSNHTSRR